MASSGVSEVFQKKIELSTNPSNVLFQGSLLTLVKQKRFLFNHYSTVTVRHVKLLRNGHLLIYKKNNEGWLMDLKRVNTLKIKRLRSLKKSDTKMRTQMDFKTEKGTISMVAIGQTGSHWIEALTGLTKEQVAEEIPVEEAQEAVEEKISSVSLYQEEGVIKNESIAMEIEELPKSTETSRSASTYSIICSGPKEVAKPKEDFQFVKEIVKQQPMAMVQPEKTVRIVDRSWHRPAVSQLSTTTESTTTEPSVRHGERSVATLRNMIEMKAQNSLRKSRSLKTAVPMAVLITKKEVFEDVHCSPGISHSAPAIFIQDEMKKDPKKKIRGSYDDCFDSSHA